MTVKKLLFGNNELVPVLKKFGLSACFVIISGLIALWQNNPKWMALIPVLETLRNMIKHY